MTSILVVEDDEAIRTAVARGLRERGYAVSTVGSGLAGVEKVVQDARTLCFWIWVCPTSTASP